MIEQVLASFIGSLLAGLVLAVPLIYLVKKRISNYNPFGGVFEE